MANDDERLRLLWIIVTCMGRRAFLQKTAPAILTQAAARQARYCLVDYSCPDACGDWLASHHAAHVAGGTAHVVAVPGRTFFHKTVALNRGARAALDAGAAALCFADADTWFAADALEHVADRLREGRFLYAGGTASGASIRSLTGLLIVSADDFRRAGGFDEAFEDWGSEDIEMRLRLHLCHGLEGEPLPARLFQPLSHDNWLRVRFHRERNIVASAARNHAQLVDRVRAWTGASLEELPASARRLLFQPAGGAR